MKLFKNLTRSFGEGFLRISSCPYSARSPHSQSHVFGQIKILRTVFEKGHLRNISVKLFQNRTSGCRGEDLKKKKKKENQKFNKNSISLPWQYRVFDGINFCEQFLKRTSQGTFLPSLVQICPAVWEENMFKEIVDDARRTHPPPPPPPQ